MIVGEKIKRVSEIVEPVLESMGYELVRLQVMGGGRPVLQIMAEHKDGSAMTVDDCADISRSLSVILDVENPIEDRYNLEVSSPGIDRPLVKLADFERFAGQTALLTMIEALDGRKKFEGELCGVIDGHIMLKIDGADLKVPYTNVARAKLTASRQQSEPEHGKKVKQNKGH